MPEPNSNANIEALLISVKESLECERQTIYRSFDEVLTRFATPAARLEVADFQNRITDLESWRNNAGQ